MPRQQEAESSTATAAGLLEALLEALDAIPDGFVLYDADDRLMLCNRAFRAFHDDVAHALRPGARFSDLLGLEAAAARRRDGDRGEIRRRCEVDCGPSCADWVSCRSVVHEETHGVMVGATADGRWMRIDEHRTRRGLVVGLRTDLSDLRDVQRQLGQSESKFRTLFAMAPVGIVRTSRDERIVDGNPAFAVITGSSPDDPRAFSEIFDPRDRDEVAADLRRGLAEGRYGPVERRLVGADGGEVVLSMEGTRAVDEDGAPFLWSILQDVTERRRAEAQIRHAAHHDVLTGLPNRKQLAEALAGLLAEEHGGALLLVDLDNFKAVNDTFGHETGDRVLVETGRRLRGGLRSADVVARLGGDEFAVVLAGPIGEADAHDLARGLVAALSRQVVGRGRTIRLGASIGLAFAPVHGREADELLRAADHALLEAKRAGRNRVTAFSPAMIARHRRRDEMSEQVRRALAAGLVSVHYQPVVDLEGGRSFGFEALCRIPIGDVATVPPIDAFRDPELGRALDEAVFDRVLADLSGWKAAGVEVGRVDVNVCEARFSEDGFVDDVFERLGRAGLDPSSIGLEVTETILLDLVGGSLPRRLERLRSGGIRIALDDFGTGHASLVHLKSLPVDRVKIDRSFVADVVFDAASRAIVEALTRLGRGLGQEVVAEGVETQGQRRALLELGCAVGQGHLFSRAVPAAEVPALVAAMDAGATGALLGKAPRHLR